MKKLCVLSLVALLFVFIIAKVPLAVATSSDCNSAVSGNSTSVTPVIEEVSYAKTIVNSTISKVEPLKVATAPENSGTPSLLWAYVLAGVGLVAATLLVFGLRRRQSKFSWLRLLSSLALVALLITPAGQVQGEGTLNVNIWGDLTSIIGRPMIVRESVDSTGKVWFGSYLSAKIGCLNPSTNEVKTWIVPELLWGFGVQTVSVDRADKVWFTSINRIGRFDPLTNFFTIWPIEGVNYYPGEMPHAFPLVSVDSHGNAYFPILEANKIGRINPATNELTEWLIPTTDSKPCYTMVDANDYVWFAELSGNKIGRLNPYTSEVTEWTIPTPDARPTGLFVYKGRIYFAEYTPRKIGCLNPATNQMTEWSLGGLPGKNLFGTFVDIDGNVWFTDYYLPGYGYRNYAYLYRLGTDNILTYWHLPPAGYYFYGVTVDTKVNVGDVYVSGYVYGSEYTSRGYAILRFRPVTP